MILRKLSVQRFRGIRALDWSPNGRVVCLVGPGDSTKTTIITAVEWALLPRWSLAVSDTDFYGATTAEPIRIEATVGDVPRSLLSDQKFGLAQRGWGTDGLHDEPEDGDDPVLTIRLTVDDSLEPRWEVVNDRQAEPRTISARDREALGATRLGTDVERHLTWGRGSGLLRLTGSIEETSRTLASAYRAAREVVNGAPLADLTAAADQASSLARAAGAGPAQTYRPGLDASAIGSGASALGLHEGSIPVRAAGLGTRRLVALAIQRASYTEGGIVLVDEIETGLEPHRLRHLLRHICADESGQLLMTTHSEIPIVELRCSDLGVVRSSDAITTVQAVRSELQAVVRRAPDALLGRRLIVCEGKTEVGLCRSLDSAWTAAKGSPPADIGLAFVVGEGTSAPLNALHLAGLGYPTALLIDSDVAYDPGEADLTAAGVRVISWSGRVSTEERILLDVPWAVVRDIVELASRMWVEDEPSAVTDSIASRLNQPSGTDIEDWLSSGKTQDQVRAAAGLAAKRSRWFKRTDMGEALGQLVVAALPSIEATDLAQKLGALADWAYDI